MEFPDLGDHCAERTCKKLDFLPMKCDGCGDFYCSEHFSFKMHGCSSGKSWLLFISKLSLDSRGLSRALGLRSELIPRGLNKSLRDLVSFKRSKWVPRDLNDIESVKKSSPESVLNGQSELQEI